MPLDQVAQWLSRPRKLVNRSREVRIAGGYWYHDGSVFGHIQQRTEYIGS